MDMNGPAKKTPMMRKVEEERGEILEILLPKLINDMGFGEAADYLGISKATVNYWRLKLGIEIKHIALVPGQRVEIRGKMGVGSND